jgi:YgiT-type zinc finger domain-containing protein
MSEAPRRSASSAPLLRTCIICGASKIVRKKVAVERPASRGSIEVTADVCTNCGERYFGLPAMRAMEA